jgi:hypothetical protein
MASQGIGWLFGSVAANAPWQFATNVTLNVAKSVCRKDINAASC